MRVLAVLLLLVGAGLASLIAIELRPQDGLDAPAAPSGSVVAPPAHPTAPDADVGPLADTLLARPLFSQTRRPPNVASPVAAAAGPVTDLPRMTGIMIDGSRRSAIFASPAAPGSKPTIVAEGGHIGPFTVQTIEPQQVIVLGPEGKRTLRTSFDPVLQPPPVPVPLGLVVPGGLPSFPPAAPSAGFGLPQLPGVAR